jgi:hypothetical protein
MTYHLVASIDCDHPEGCQEFFRLLPGEALGEARQRARSRGWTSIRSPLKMTTLVRDFCPAHAKEN